MVFYAKKIQETLFPYLNYKKNVVFAVPTQYLIEKYESAFRISKDNYLVFPHARNAVFYSDFEWDVNFFHEVPNINKRFFDDDSRVIVWMPTHRVKSGLNKGGFSDYIEKQNLHILNEVLHTNNVKLIIKVHPIEKGISKYCR